MLLAQGRVWGLSSPLVAVPPPRSLHIPELAPACPCRGQQERGPEPDTPLRRAQFNHFTCFCCRSSNSSRCLLSSDVATACGSSRTFRGQSELAVHLTWVKSTHGPGKLWLLLREKPSFLHCQF